jgi:DNA polymerase III subunit gamma/tau
MDKFIVSARKYRPQTFDTVIGQLHITTTLKNAIKNNQLAHAFLFCGPRGVGKTTCARILAKTINCTNLQPDGEACDVCQSCKSFNDGASLNIHELDAASNNSVDDIRSLVEQVRFAPQAGKYKIYIVDEVHMLSTSAFNAFLKTLEEPPAYAIFILATTEKHKILPTILSRCQIFDFKRITNNDTAQHLQQIVNKEHINADKASLQIIAQKSEGCMRDALSILDKIVSFTNGEVNYQNTIENLNILDHDYYFKLLENLQQQDMASALLLYNEINNKGFEGDTVLNGFAEFLRNILVCKDVKAAQLLDVVEGMQEKYFTTAQKINASYLVAALNILNDAELNFKMARNKKLHIELALIKLSFLQQAIDISFDNGQIVKKKRVDSPIAISYKPIKSIATTQPKIVGKTTPEAAVLKIESETKTSNEKTETRKETPNSQPKTVINEKLATAKGRNLLDILKEKAGNKYTVQEIKEAEPLNSIKLNDCIANYIVELEKEGGKLSTINNFKMAAIEVADEVHFKITAASLVALRSIEQEKTSLNDLVKKAFNNAAIYFSLEVGEMEVDEVNIPKYNNLKDKYEYITSLYPLVKEFKEKLRLDVNAF